MISAQEVNAVIFRIQTLLAGQPPQLVGPVLADLLALWLACNYVEDDEAATVGLREKLLANLCAVVRRRTARHAKAMGTTP
jgi:hypothetical protein